MTNRNITSAEEWQQGEIVTLPSGRVVKLQRPSLVSLITSGVFPNQLLVAARSVLEGKAPEYSDEKLPEYLKVVEIAVAQAFLEPKCISEGTPEAGEISISWVSDDDKTFIMRYLQRGLEAAEKFRREQRPGGKSRPSGKAVRTETEQPVGD